MLSCSSLFSVYSDTAWMISLWHVFCTISVLCSFSLNQYCHADYLVFCASLHSPLGMERRGELNRLHAELARALALCSPYLNSWKWSATLAFTLPSGGKETISFLQGSSLLQIISPFNMEPGVFTTIWFCPVFHFLIFPASSIVISLNASSSPGNLSSVSTIPVRF